MTTANPTALPIQLEGNYRILFVPTVPREIPQDFAADLGGLYATAGEPGSGRNVKAARLGQGLQTWRFELYEGFFHTIRLVMPQVQDEDAKLGFYNPLQIIPENVTLESPSIYHLQIAGTTNNGVLVRIQPEGGIGPKEGSDYVTIPLGLDQLVAERFFTAPPEGFPTWLLVPEQD